MTRTPSVVPPAPARPLPGVRRALTGTHPIGRTHSDPRPLVKPANNAFAGFFLIGPGQTGMALLSSYVSGSALTGSLTLTGQSFASLGIATGTYVSSWNNGGISDGLTMTINPSQSVPETGSALCMLGLSVAGMIVAARRWAVAPTVHST